MVPACSAFTRGDQLLLAHDGHRMLAFCLPRDPRLRPARTIRRVAGHRPWIVSVLWFLSTLRHLDLGDLPRDVDRLALPAMAERPGSSSCFRRHSPSRWRVICRATAVWVAFDRVEGQPPPRKCSGVACDRREWHFMLVAHDHPLWLPTNHARSRHPGNSFDGCDVQSALLLRLLGKDPTLVSARTTRLKTGLSGLCDGSLTRIARGARPCS